MRSFRTKRGRRTRVVVAPAWNSPLLLKKNALNSKKMQKETLERGTEKKKKKK